MTVSRGKRQKVLPTEDGPRAPHEHELTRAIHRLCVRLEGVTGSLERLARIVVRHVSGDSPGIGQDAPAQAPEPAPGELPGQGVLDFEAAPRHGEPTTPAAGPAHESAARPDLDEPRVERVWTFGRLARHARDLVRANPGRDWDAVELCRTLRGVGVHVRSWRGLPLKLKAQLMRNGTIVSAGERRFRAAIGNPPDARTRLPEPRRGEKQPGPLRAVEPVGGIPWDDIVTTARSALAEVPTRVWTRIEIARRVREAGVTSPTWAGIEFGLVARLGALGLIEHLDRSRFRVRTPVEHPPDVQGLERTEGDAATREGTAAREPPAAQVGEPGVHPERPAAADPVFAISDEVTSLSPWLGDLPKRQSTAQIAVWAGRLRRLHDSLGDLEQDRQRRVRAEIRSLIAWLARLAKQHRCDWIDALSSEWDSADWDTYVAFNEVVAGGRDPDLTGEEEARYHRDRLRGLFSPHRLSAARDAQDVLREALRVLPEHDGAVARAIQAFGRPTERRVEPPRPKAPFQRQTDRSTHLEEPPPLERNVPPEVLGLTRGKYGLVAGGQGSREAHRIAIERSLEFEKLEWVYGERGKGSHLRLLEERMWSGRYDLVLLLASHSGHDSGGLVAACRAVKVPLVYLSRGYSVTSVIEAICQQLAPRRGPREPPARR
jgi:hypothetical protein